MAGSTPPKLSGAQKRKLKREKAKANDHQPMKQEMLPQAAPEGAPIAAAAPKEATQVAAVPKVQPGSSGGKSMADPMVRQQMELLNQQREMGIISTQQYLQMCTELVATQHTHKAREQKQDGEAEKHEEQQQLGAETKTKSKASGAEKRKRKREDRIAEESRKRKQLTEFKVGDKCEGRVTAYHADQEDPDGISKGVFIDIGAVRDGFCHVSRLSSEFVEDARKKMKIGERVNARVLDVMPKKNKITLTLQPESMMTKEAESMTRFRSPATAKKSGPKRSAAKQAARNQRRLEKKNGVVAPVELTVAPVLESEPVSKPIAAEEKERAAPKKMSGAEKRKRKREKERPGVVGEKLSEASPAPKSPTKQKMPAREELPPTYEEALVIEAPKKLSGAEKRKRKKEKALAQAAAQ